MTNKMTAKKKKASALPPGLPDLAWYRDAANRKKRHAHIQNLCEQIAREFRPDKIILFGEVVALLRLRNEAANEQVAQH